MKDARLGKPDIDELRHTLPCEAVFLAAPPERSSPEVGHVVRIQPLLGCFREQGSRNASNLVTNLLWHVSNAMPFPLDHHTPEKQTARANERYRKARARGPLVVDEIKKSGKSKSSWYRLKKHYANLNASPESEVVSAVDEQIIAPTVKPMTPTVQEIYAREAANTSSFTPCKYHGTPPIRNVTRDIYIMGRYL